MTSCASPDASLDSAPNPWDGWPDLTVTSPERGAEIADDIVTVSGAGPPGITLTIAVIPDNWPLTPFRTSSEVTVEDDGTWSYVAELSEGKTLFAVSYFLSLYEGGPTEEIVDYTYVTHYATASPDLRGPWMEDTCRAMAELRQALIDYEKAWVFFIDTEPDYAAELADQVLSNLARAEQMMTATPPSAEGEELVAAATRLIGAMRSGAEGIHAGRDPGIDAWTAILDIYYDELVIAANRVFEPGFGCGLSQLL